MKLFWISRVGVHRVRHSAQIRPPHFIPRPDGDGSGREPEVDDGNLVKERRGARRGSRQECDQTGQQKPKSKPGALHSVQRIQPPGRRFDQLDAMIRFFHTMGKLLG